MTTAASRPPDILLVVMDCMRADVFEAGVADATVMPFAHALRNEVLSFSGAVAPSAWTIPSHASLFTGLYPWDHSAHYRTGAVLPRGPETLAECLGRQGYATACFSANHLVQPATGLSRGFDEVLWGGEQEFFLRFLPRQGPTCPSILKASVGQKDAGEETSRLPIARAREMLANGFATLPPVWDAVNRIGARVMRPHDPPFPAVSRWIEERLDGWLARQPADQPVFAFVNLLEAHEPYLAGAGSSVGLRAWSRYARHGQAPYRWIFGKWQPSEPELVTLRDAYRRTLRTVDPRLQAIVERFSRRGRWDNTLFVLTSDHGQAFLEASTMYHRIRADEPIARIPLWIRSPGRGPRGLSSDAWVSLVDVPRTLAAAAGRGTFGDAESCSLLEPPGSWKDRTVFSMNDGLPPRESTKLSPERKGLLDRIGVSAYREGWKAVAEDDGQVHVYRVSRTSPGWLNPALDASPEGGQVGEIARSKLAEALSKVESAPHASSPELRIAAWGY